MRIRDYSNLSKVTEFLYLRSLNLGPEVFLTSEPMYILLCCINLHFKIGLAFMYLNYIFLSTQFIKLQLSFEQDFSFGIQIVVLQVPLYSLFETQICMVVNSIDSRDSGARYPGFESWPFHFFSSVNLDKLFSLSVPKFSHL